MAKKSQTGSVKKPLTVSFRVDVPVNPRKKSRRLAKGRKGPIKRTRKLAFNSGNEEKLRPIDPQYEPPRFAVAIGEPSPDRQEFVDKKEESGFSSD